MKVNAEDYSLNYIKKQSQQGKYSKEYEANFDYINNFMFFNNDSIAIKKKIYNSISIISFLREQILSLNDKFTFDIYTSGKIKPIGMQVVDEERIKVHKKVYDCFVLSPYNVNETEINSKKGQIKLWISKDSHIPVIIEQEAKHGKILLKLNHISYAN